MIRVFVCLECGKIRIVSKFLKAECYQCGAQMKPCGIPYTEWVEMSREEREQISEKFRNQDS